MCLSVGKNKEGRLGPYTKIYNMHENANMCYTEHYVPMRGQYSITRRCRVWPPQREAGNTHTNVTVEAVTDPPPLTLTDLPLTKTTDPTRPTCYVWDK